MKILYKGIGVRTKANGITEYSSWVVFGVKVFGIIIFRSKYYAHCNSPYCYLTWTNPYWYNDEETALSTLNKAIKQDEKDELNRKIVSYKEKIIS